MKGMGSYPLSLREEEVKEKKVGRPLGVERISQVPAHQGWRTPHDDRWDAKGSRDNKQLILWGAGRTRKRVENTAESNTAFLETLQSTMPRDRREVLSHALRDGSR